MVDVTLRGTKGSPLTHDEVDANFTNLKTAVETNQAGLADAGGVSVYATIDDLPMSGNSNGDLALVSSTNRLYLFTNSGWYSIALINQTPTISGNDASYTLAKDGTPTVVTLTGADPEGIPITWSHVATGLTNEATVTNVDNVFTITPSTNEANAGEFSVTFRASDGVNIGTATSEFTLSFFTPYDVASLSSSTTYTAQVYTSRGLNFSSDGLAYLQGTGNRSLYIGKLNTPFDWSSSPPAGTSRLWNVGDIYLNPTDIDVDIAGFFSNDSKIWVWDFTGYLRHYTIDYPTGTVNTTHIYQSSQVQGSTSGHSICFSADGHHMYTWISNYQINRYYCATPYEPSSTITESVTNISAPSLSSGFVQFGQVTISADGTRLLVTNGTLNSSVAGFVSAIEVSLPTPFELTGATFLAEHQLEVTGGTYTDGRSTYPIWVEDGTELHLVTRQNIASVHT